MVEKLTLKDLNYQKETLEEIIRTSKKQIEINIKYCKEEETEKLFELKENAQKSLYRINNLIEELEREGEK